MELLKSTKQIFLSLGILILFSFNISAQDFKTLEEQFKNSYTFENEGDYTKARDALKQVYKGQEDNYIINLRLGWLTYMEGSFNESIAYYQKAIELQPMSIEARFGLVYPASGLGNWDQVKAQYKKILEIDPQNTLANYRMGYIFYGIEDYQTALKYFEKVVNLYPFDYDSVIMLAWTNFKLGKLREAKVLFQKALLYNPGDESATEGLSLIQ